MISFLHFKLLNEKNDDDEEARAEVKTRDELLQQLMKDGEGKLQEQQVYFTIRGYKLK